MTVKESAKCLIITPSAVFGLLPSTVAEFLIYASDYYSATYLATTTHSSECTAIKRETETLRFQTGIGAERPQYAYSR